MKENSIRGVIFDLDGTLIDSYQAIYLSFHHAYRTMGLPPLSFEEVKAAVGYGLGKTFSDLLGEERAPEALRLFREKYEEVFRQNTHLLEGAREVLETLHKKGIRLAIATNKLGRFSRELFQHFGMEKIFATIVGDGDVAENKPHPAMISYALEKMSLAREEVIFIGDSLIDIQTAKNAHLRIFAVPTGTQEKVVLEEAQPTLVLNRLQDLLQYV